MSHSHPTCNNIGQLLSLPFSTESICKVTENNQKFNHSPHTKRTLFDFGFASALQEGGMLMSREEGLDVDIYMHTEAF